MKRVSRIIPLVVVGLVLAAPAGADEPARGAQETSPVGEEARAHHRRGLELYDEGDYRLALVEFQRAYAVGQNHKSSSTSGRSISS